MSRKRQMQHSKEVRERILDIAKRIVTDEGVDALSIRRITKEMDYSAGIVYHYFENKEQILSGILLEGYDKIMKSIQPVSEDLPPDELFRTTALNFMEGILKWPNEYKAIMLNSSPQILEFTSVLGEGYCEKHPALMVMVKTLEAGISEGLFSPCDAQLTSQAIWSAMYGLHIRLFVEQNVSREHAMRLIERQIELILSGLKACNNEKDSSQ